MDEFDNYDEELELDNFDEYDEDSELDTQLEEDLYSKMTEIIKISKLIAKLYKRIIFDGCSEYLLNELRKSVILEKKLYEQIELNPCKETFIKGMLYELEDIYGKSLGKVFGAACNDDIENMWLYRISNKFANMKDNDFTSSNKEEHGNNFYLTQQEFSNIKYEKIDEAISNDFIHAFIYFMNEEIENCEDHVLKQNLIETKYKLIYSTEALDEEFVAGKTENDDFLYITFGYISDYFNTSREMQKRIQQDASLSYLDYAISNLDLLNALDGDEYLKTIFSIYFRAGLAILYNNDDYESLVEEIKTDIIGDDEEQMFSSIEMYLDENNDDIGKCKYLSIIKPNNY